MARDPSEWFYAWALRLTSRVREPFGGWPDSESEWWLGVLDWMTDHRITQEQSERMLSLIQRKPPKCIDETIEALGRCLAVIRKEGGEYSDQREKASRECKELGCECGGMGLVSRDHRRAEYGLYTVSYYCPGPAGRFLEAAHKRNHLDGIRSIVGSGLERIEDESEFCQAAPERHRRLARWFAQRCAAIRDNRPMPPDPPEVQEMNQRAANRYRGLSGRVREAFPVTAPVPPPPPPPRTQ